MYRYKDMTRCSLGTSLQWLECLETLDLDHFLTYCIPSEGLTILMVKLGVLINVPGNLDSILVLDTVSLSLGIKYLGHPNELLGIISEAP